MPGNEITASTNPSRAPWNKGKLIGARPPTTAQARLVR